MTTDDLNVYGKRIGSLWDRRIGGRYELTEITDCGGLGMWVTLQRVNGGNELSVSVYNLGLNYVSVPEQAEPAEDEQQKPWPFDAILNFGDHVTLDGTSYFVVDADGKPILEPEPAPAPPLPWIEHPDAWWQSSKDGWLTPSSQMGTTRDPAVWRRVAVIPWKLIERFRQSADLGEAIMRDKALLDAADGVTS